jgi:hypothetical protein
MLSLNPITSPWSHQPIQVPPKDKPLTSLSSDQPQPQGLSGIDDAEVWFHELVQVNNSLVNVEGDSDLPFSGGG